MATGPIRIKLRRGENGGGTGWSAINTILAQGEPGFATDTGVIKIGNGVAGWNGLKTFSPTLNPSGTAVAIGSNAGNNQGEKSIAIGTGAGNNQGEEGIAIGNNAGSRNQGIFSLLVRLQAQ
jgi:hypothetical protein